MSVFTIAGQSIVAGVERDSPSQQVPASLLTANIRLTDPNGVWATTAGNITIWGVQYSTDGFATSTWLGFATGIPFGTLERDGGLPQVNISAIQFCGNVVGVTNVNNPTVTTDQPHGLSANQSVTIQQVQGATGVNGTFTVRSVVSPTAFTVTTPKPGTYTGGGVVLTPAQIVPSGAQVRLSILTDADIVLGCTITTTP